MVADFALIAEGVTDHAVLENVLLGCFHDPEIKSLQPLRDATDKQEGRGGWELVLEYLGNKAYRQAFQFHDYVVVQIDTDASGEVNFNVPKVDDQGKDLTPGLMIEAVAQKLQDIIAQHPNAEYYLERTLLAISVHSLECWLLPLHVKDRKKHVNTKNCFHLLERELAKSKNNKLVKDYRTYDQLSKDFRKLKNLGKAAASNPSLGVFTEVVQGVICHAEAAFLASKHVECAARITSCLQNDRLIPRTQTALHALGLANAVALKQPLTGHVHALQRLLDAPGQAGKWPFRDCIDHIEDEPTFQEHAARLIDVMQALEAGDKERVLSALSLLI